MATFRKRGGRWHVQIRRRGYCPISKTFFERAFAEKWARDIESHIDKGTYLDTSEAHKTTVGQVIQRYTKEIIPTKRGGDVEIYRTKTLERHLGNYTLAQLRPYHVAQYRDHRLRTISPASLKRELVILSRIMTLVTKDWGITLPHGNPVSQISVANGDVQRTRRLTKEEEHKLLNALSGSIEIQIIVRIALETVCLPITRLA